MWGIRGEGRGGVKGSGRGVSMASSGAGELASCWAWSACPRIVGSPPARIRQAHPGQTMATYVTIGTGTSGKARGAQLGAATQSPKRALPASAQRPPTQLRTALWEKTRKSPTQQVPVIYTQAGAANPGKLRQRLLRTAQERATRNKAFRFHFPRCEV